MSQVIPLPRATSISPTSPGRTKRCNTPLTLSSLVLLEWEDGVDANTVAVSDTFESLDVPHFAQKVSFG